MFGGAHFDGNTGRHTVVNNRVWTFDFAKLEWSVSPSMAMVRPTYFHSATMNEVRIRNSVRIESKIDFCFLSAGGNLGLWWDR